MPLDSFATDDMLPFVPTAELTEDEQEALLADEDEEETDHDL